MYRIFPRNIKFLLFILGTASFTVQRFTEVVLQSRPTSKPGFIVYNKNCFYCREFIVLSNIIAIIIRKVHHNIIQAELLI